MVSPCAVQGFRQQALAVSTDPEHQFELALHLGELKMAQQLASEAQVSKPRPALHFRKTRQELLWFYHHRFNAALRFTFNCSLWESRDCNVFSSLRQSREHTGGIYYGRLLSHVQTSEPTKAFTLQNLSKRLLSSGPIRPQEITSVCIQLKNKPSIRHREMVADHVAGSIQ